VVVDRPFVESREMIAGFRIFTTDSLEKAIEWVRRAPNPTGEESEIEIRQIFEADDLGPALTPELRAREERISRRMEANTRT
jgi:hypothetical protein